MRSGLADFIESHAEDIVEQAVAFARAEETGAEMSEVELRDHLPEIIQAVVDDMRTPQTRAESIEKVEGRAPEDATAPRSAAGTHAVHRAHSGFSISSLVAEYRAMRAAVLRMWAESPGAVIRNEEITRFNEAIDQAIAESVRYYSDEVERWRNIFLGVLGHDLRSPLTAIMVASEVIAGMAVDPPLAKVAERLVNSGDRMRELLDKLLLYNRAQMGIGLEVNRQKADLAEAFGDEIEQLRQTMPRASIFFSSEGDAQGEFDARSLCEALTNLMVNAYKYGTSGTPIEVALRAAGGRVELSVSNQGPTIPPDSLQMLFEPLRRGGVSNKSDMERSSLGLGLFIVSQIAEAHGGAIRAESTGGRTTFTMTLPKG